jgi:D-beta-D-heptose 7-phosphate kinase / D-beta-D-heptose 1-phosphate adenosyltransferase
MKEILERIKGSSIRIGVVGDSMLDEYYDVSVRKISPEFPIPVMHSKTTSPIAVLPGGAANVAYQLDNFNHETLLCSFLDDEAEAMLKSHDVDTSLCVKIDPYLIPRKKRFYNGDFPTYRWDVEMHHCGMEDGKLKAAAKELADKIMGANFDVLIFSDYDKGVFASSVVSSLAARHPCPIRIVDPKNDLMKWRGCTLVKPNTSEARSLTGKSSSRDQAMSIMSATACQSVIVTAEGSGFSGVDGEFFEYKSPRKPSSVNSVIGAGDCFIAFLGLCMGNGVCVRRSAEFAFEMGSTYVTDKHNKPIDMERARRAILGSESKIVPYDSLASRDFKLVVTNGCFDILHAGHIQSLEFAKRQGDRLMVAVNSDHSVSRIKPGRPINKLQHRMKMLAGLECVDYVCSFDEETPRKLMDIVRPNVIVKGMDYHGKEVVGSNVAGEVIYAPFVDGVSTTGIIESIVSRKDI